MPASGSLIVADVYRQLQDDSGNPVVAEDVIRQHVMDNVIAVADEVGCGTAWSTSIITTTLVDRSYNFPTANSFSSFEYSQLLALRYASDLKPINKVNLDEIIAANETEGALAARQYRYAVRIDTSARVVIEFAGLPNRVENIDALVSYVPFDWVTGAGTVPTIPFSREGIKGVTLLAAASVFETLGEDKRIALNLSKDFAKSERAQGNDLVQKAKLKVIRLKRTYGTNPDGWLAAWSTS